jgi:hypothetical protein
MIDLGAVGVRGNPVYHQRRFGDLIPYQNDGKYCTMIAGNVERT